MPKITVGNVCFVKDKDTNKILFLKRNREPMSGMVTGVGGKTEFDEDINASCVREVFEETGLKVKDVSLKGVVKTILEGKDSSWILFVYTANKADGNLIDCNEGELCWVDDDQVYSQNLIGFIRKIMPAVLEEKGFLEGTIVHDLKGNIVKETLNVL